MVTVQNFSAKTCPLADVSSWAEAWETLQSSNTLFWHPMLHWRWLELVSQCRPNGFVTIQYNHEEPVAGFAFEQKSRWFGYPIGQILSDRHAILAKSVTDMEPRQLLVNAGLLAWYFDHVPASLLQMQSFSYSSATGWQIRIEQGFNDYWAKVQGDHSSWLGQVNRKRRKVERDLGKLNFVLHSSDPTVIDALIQWKRQQLASTSKYNVFQDPGSLKLIHALANYDSPDFCGRVSALYAGQQLLATNIGQLAGTGFNVWIPTYNPNFAQYSPGVLMHVELIKAFSELGVSRFDLGQGANQIKQTLANFQEQQLSGVVDRSCWLAWVLRNGRSVVKRFFKKH